MDHDLAVERLRSSDPVEVCTTLVSITFHDSDRGWVESECLRLSADPDPQVRGCAATCIGHLARMHGRISTAARQRIETLLKDHQVRGIAEDALGDIRHYVDRRPQEPVN
jgi:hypothetical protein